MQGVNALIKQTNPRKKNSNQEAKSIMRAERVDSRIQKHNSSGSSGSLHTEGELVNPQSGNKTTLGVCQNCG